MRPRRPAAGRLEGTALLLAGIALLTLLVLALTGALRGNDMLGLLRDWGPVTALVAFALACLIAGLRAATRRAIDVPARPPLRPIRWWAVAAAFAAVVTATWAGVSWLLGVATPNDGAARLEAIKTGLAIGAGTGAAIALLFTARRQWLSERSQAHTEVDTTERRVSEMYAKAADQFSTDKDAVVRLAGLFALERLAQDYAAHRAAVVNLICAYLSSASPAAGRTLGVRVGKPESRPPSPRKDKQVRLAAQEVLTGHLRPVADTRERPTDPKFWPDTDIDLAGATLTDFDFRGCRVRSARFAGTHFEGDSTFFLARFAEVSFTGARFTGGATFDSARFDGAARFEEVRFTGDVVFSGASFAQKVSFQRARFLSDARFNRVSWPFVTFRGASFGGQAEFIATDTGTDLSAAVSGSAT
jgi:hypothetical protein